MIITRYLLKELTLPFLFSLVAFGSIMTTGFVLFNLIEETVQYHIPLGLFLKILLLRLPEMLFYTLPMSMLLACLLAMGRLSSDRELMVLRISGQSFYALSRPFIGFAVVITLVTIVLNETIVPLSGYIARQTLHYARTQSQTLPKAKEHVIYREIEQQQLKKLLYAQTFDGYQMQNVIAQLFEADQLRILRAKRARQEKGEWIFEEGEIIELKKIGSEVQGFLKFKRYTLRLDLSFQQVLEENRQPLEMNLISLGNYIEQLAVTPTSLAALKVRWHQKLAIPCAAVVFTLLGLGLAGRTMPTTSLSLGLSILIIFGYYVSMAIFTALGDTDQLTPWLGAWIPNLIGLVIGGYLIERQNRGEMTLKEQK